ncbi:hypothetical protein FF38_05861 [Lucilia cuprina]|uniref:PHD-type domain-containing protein n=1 Tax=Lucilia cuprina TaxID=7375 RepID=A0A0L0BZL0_LUCCU|nr:hypothetical protein FF38_05861 [Lucilia cuprina]
MPSTRIFKCVVCSDNICKTQPSIQCCSCKLWLHVKCSGTNEKDLAGLKGNKYTCAICNNQPRTPETDGSVKSEICALKSVIDNFINKVENDHISARSDLSSLNTKIDNFIMKVDGPP